MANATVTKKQKTKEQEQAQATLRCLMHKARATKLVLAKYCVK